MSPERESSPTSLRRIGKPTLYGKRHCLQVYSSVMTNSAVRMGSKLSADDRRVQQTHLSYDGEGRLSTLTEESMKNLLLDLPRKRGREQVPLLDQKRRR